MILIKKINTDITYEKLTLYMILIIIRIKQKMEGETNGHSPGT